MDPDDIPQKSNLDECNSILKEENKLNILKEFEQIINRNCLENISNTPDWILAEFIEDCFKALNNAINKREAWYGRITTESDIND